jgi:hypothetical protein
MSIAEDKQQITARITRFIEDETCDSFAAAATALFKFQFDHLPAARAYYLSSGLTPENLATYKDIPPVGLNVFKETIFFAGEEPLKTFHTSGTSGKGRGSSSFARSDLDIMETSILTNCRNHLFADNLKTRFLMLLPAPQEAPDMIMAYGMSRIARKWGLGPPFYAIKKGRFLGPETISFIRKAISDQAPLAIIGGSFGFVNFIDNIKEKINNLPLAEGSRLLDAGGFKGRSRELDRQDFLNLTSSFFNIPAQSCFNLYGLTELASQFYSRGSGPKHPPHWARVRVCHPLTMKEVADNRQGIAILYDLANISRPFVILTDDLARNRQPGFELLGRASGAAPRGCSLALEDIR